jgi:hypothetical protein
MNEHQAIIKILGDILRSLEYIIRFIIFFGTIICILLLFGCANYTYNGIRGEDLQHPSAKMLAGAGTSFVVHTVGHFAVMSAMGKELHFEGLSEITNDELTDAEAA